ncbi:helix-turn-helix transcriptional regulator [Streptomyces parvus]|uniref:helix-turn-helix transcriptional regulator n=1 Tax=Streptomyces parvus TaxID=66428 RepID=UPI0033E4DAB9
MAKAIDPQSSMAALFGSRLRKLRVAAGLTQAEVGALAHVVSSRIAQLERATGAKPTLELTRVLDKELVADDLLIDLWPCVPGGVPGLVAGVHRVLRPCGGDSRVRLARRARSAANP